MELKTTLKKAIGFCGILLSVGILHAQTAAPSSLPYEGGDQGKQNWIQSNPDAYRKMGGQVETPAKESHQFTTEAEKAEWIQNHPAEYAKMTNGQSVSKTKQVNPVVSSTSNAEVAPAAASTMPWGAPENKAAWIAAHPAEYQQMTGTVVTSPDPWGDESNKAAWIAAHPEEFAAMNRVNTHNNSVKQTKSTR